MEKKKKVIGYARVSTREQVEGFSLDYQTREIYKKATTLKLDICQEDIYLEEGVSAKNLNRPQMKEIISQIENDEISIIIIYKLDRLSRTLKDVIYFIDLCLQKDVDLISIRENIDMTTPMGRMMVYMFGVMAQFEREQISERTVNGMKEKAMQGFYPHGNKPPFGYRKNEQHKLIIIESESIIIKEAMKLYAYNNWSEYHVSEYIKNKYGKYMSAKNLRKYLLKPIHFGKAIVAGKEYDVVDPIFSEEDRIALEKRKVLNVYTKKEYKYFNKVFINGKLSGHETIRKKMKSGDTKVYVYYLIRDIGRIEESVIVKQVLLQARQEEGEHGLKTKYKLGKMANALFEGTITKKQFTDYYNKESRKLLKFSNEIEKVNVTIVKRKVKSVEVKFYKKKCA